MGSGYFMTGGVVGARIQITDTDRYIVGETTVQDYVPLTYVGGKTLGGVGGTANITITLTGLTGGAATTPSTDDIVIIAWATGSASNRAFTTSSTGWTLLEDLYSNGTTYDTNLSIWYKVMGSTPDASFVLTGGSASTQDGYSYTVHVWRGVDTTNPLDVTTTTATGTATSAPSPPAITPITPNAEIDVVGAGAAATGTTTFAALDLAHFLWSNGADTNDGASAIGSITWDSSGTYTPAVWTGGSVNAANSWAASTIALRPMIGDVTTTIYGNQKNSGIWSIRAAFRGSLVPNPISYVDSFITASDGTNAVTSLNITVPLDVQADDLIIICCGNDNAAATPIQWDNNTLKPTGFTLINQITTATADACTAAFYKVASGTEGGTTISVPAASAFDMWAGCIILRNVNISNPIRIVGTNYDVASATTHSIPGISTIADTMMIFCGSADGADNAPFTINTGNPDNMIQASAGTGGTASVAGLMGWKFIDTDRTTLDQQVVFNAAISDGFSGFQFAINSVNVI